MVDPATITLLGKLAELGSTGLLLIVVVLFLNYIDKRDKQWQQYFKEMHQVDSTVLVELKSAFEAVKNELVSLRSEFHAHDEMEREVMRNVIQPDVPAKPRRRSS
jgi:hypothetical protein